MADKNEVTDKVKNKNRKKAFYDSKVEELKKAIIDSFNESVDKGNAIWELPIVNANYMNPASGVVYSPLNVALITAQMNARRMELQINEFRKSPVLLAKMMELADNPDPNIKFDVLRQLRISGENDIKIKNALKKADKEIAKVEISPFFMTYKQLLNTYDNKGAKSYKFLQTFPLSLYKKGKKDEDLNKEDQKQLKELEDAYKEDLSDNEDILTEDKENVKRITSNIMVQNVYDAYNYSDLKVKEGIEEPKGYIRRMKSFEKEVMPEEIKTVIDSLINISPFPVMRVVGEKSSAFFSEHLTAVNVAPSSFFKNDMVELHTIAHEVIHAYGGAANMELNDYKKYKRECYKEYSTSNKFRAEEELIANVGATMLLNMFNIKSNEEGRMEAFKANHEVYDHGWATCLKEDHNAVYRAMNMAEKITKNLFFKIKQDLTLRFEKDPDLAIPPFIKDEIVSKKKIKTLDADIAKDYVPQIKDEKTLDTKKLYGNRPPRRR